MMNSRNKFYDEFDMATRAEGAELDYRTLFQRERDRIIYNSAFRRLQSKTQVFFSGEYDFYRTRLTHSLEVAQIGRSICYYLWNEDPALKNHFYIDPDLVEAVCLAHDMGHPPFGHAGERILNRLMLPFGGFEGNAQTLRMLTDIIYSDSGRRKGMNPSRALLDGVLKYKTLFGESPDKSRHFLYDDQRKILDFVLDNRSFPPDLSPGKARNGFRSIECQIMDWADDTAYSLNDIVDGRYAGFINRRNLEHWAAGQQISKVAEKWITELMDSLNSNTLERDFARKIGKFIKASRLIPQESLLSDISRRFSFSLQVEDEVQEESALYQHISRDLVFRSPQLHQLEVKWDHVLTRLFTIFQENYSAAEKNRLTLFSKEVDDLLRREEQAGVRARLICDQIAGMTDGFALRTFKRLFDPDFGSILDLV